MSIKTPEAPKEFSADLPRRPMLSNVIARVGVGIAALCISAARANSAPVSAETPRHISGGNQQRVPDHLWKVIAESDNQVNFIDQSSLRPEGSNSFIFWSLWTTTNNNLITKYEMRQIKIDCQSKTLMSIGGVIYDEVGLPTYIGQTLPQILPPESNGDRQWLYVCGHTDKYSMIPMVYSVAEAKLLSLQLKSAEVIEASLLSDSDIMQIANTFEDTLANSGETGLTILIKDCYKNLYRSISSTYRHDVSYCVTLDVLTYQTDKFFRVGSGGQSIQDPPVTPYWKDGTFIARMKKYMPNTTLDHSMPDIKIFNDLSGRASKDVVDLISHDSRMNK